MPLIIITGTPCSGKTRRARQILKEFESRIKAATDDVNRTVVYIPSYHACLDPPVEDSNSYQPPDPSINPRDQIYDLARLEKTARAEEFSAIKRAVNKNTVVIADAPNYIKGFRYQLFCEAKAASTRSVVVHSAAREDECIAWNTARLEAWNWPISEEGQAGGNGTKTQVPAPNIGKDVLGDLKPESHTAIYGDSVAMNGTRSRSSSTGAAVSDDEAELSQKAQTDETMTLKSLYIADRVEPATTDSQPLQNISEQTDAPTSQESRSSHTPSTLPSTRSSLPYSPTTLTSLFMRYEPPSPFTRWDTPLFTIPSTDAHPPYDEIWSAIFPTTTNPPSKKALSQQHHPKQTSQQNPPTHQTTTPAAAAAEVKQYRTTILPTASAPNALQLLELTTGEITKLILSAARDANLTTTGDGGTITISLPSHDPSPTNHTNTIDIDVTIPEGIVLSQPALQRLRRKYTQVQRGAIAHRQGYTQGRGNIAVSFARFLEAEWAGLG